MAVGSGLGGSLGYAAEPTYGVFTTPTFFTEPDKVDLKKVKNTVQGGGLASGRLVQAGSRRVVVSEAGTGSIDQEVTNKGMGLLLQHIFGGSSAPVQQVATPAYKQTHPLVDNRSNYLTAQSGVPDAGGTVRPYTATGGKVTSAEFSCGVGELLKVALELDFQKITEAETLAAPSYATGVRGFHFKQMALKLGTFGTEVAVDGVKKVNIKLERGQATDRFYANATGLKANPLVNEFIKVSGSIDADFLDKATFADKFASDTPTSLVWEFEGPVIATTYKERFTLRVPMTFFDGDTPVIEGPGVVSGSFPFVGQFDLTNAAVICEYVSVDTII